MRRSVLCMLAFLLVFALIPVVSAQTQPRQKAPGPLGGFGDFSLIFVSAQSEVAHGQGIGSWGGGLSMGGGLDVGRILVLGCSADGEFAKDRDPFTNSTTGGTMKSSAMYLGASVYAGLHSPGIKVNDQGRVLQLGVNYGKTWMKANRSINNCIGCDSENMTIRAGAFVEPTLQLGSKEGRKGSVFYFSVRKYLNNSDMNWAAQVGMRRFF